MSTKHLVDTMLARSQRGFKMPRPDAYGWAAVANIIQQAEVPMSDSDKSLPNVVLTVVEDKIANEPGATDNPAHALICGWSRESPTQSRKISRSVAKRLLDVFRWESLPVSKSAALGVLPASDRRD